MKISTFVLFLALFLSCLIAARANDVPMFSLFTNKKLSIAKIENSLFEASEILIDESRLIDSSQAGKKEEDIIQSLPGQPKVYFKQYGGYVTVNSKKGTAFYYYLVEARESPETSPLLLWLNGGPGCSSLGYGAMVELGPFRVLSDGKTLIENDYAWNKNANVLFLESPAGVGFSYSNTTADFVSGGDRQTAADNYVFLANWLERFPEYKTKDVYISGESYAGHYVPQLAQIVLHQNKRAQTLVNLKGIIIGNSVINDGTDVEGMFKYWGSHALISDDLTDQILKSCGISPKGHMQKPCDKVVDEAYNLTDKIDIYSIYEPLCHEYNITDKPKKASIFKFDPCSDYYVYRYLNQADVQKALHANITNIPYTWSPCSYVLQNWTDSASTVLPSIKEFMKNGLRVWMYSGDTDGRVPVTSTQLGIREMKLRIKDSWHAWYTQGEVGGYTQEYEDNLTFVTVRGAGHQVPCYQPERALSLIIHFLDGKKLPIS